MADKNITINLENNKMKDFLSYIKELSSIDPTIAMVIKDDVTMFYSFVGSSISDVHAFKTVFLPTEDIFKKRKTIEDKIIFIIKDGKKFYRNIQNFIDYDEEIKIKITYDDEDNYGHFLNLNNSKIRLKEISGDPMTISKDITIDDIKQLTNKETSILNFTVSELDFKKIKNMSNIDTTNDVLNIKIIENELFIGETKWEIKICDIDKSNLEVSFPKKYFKNLKFTENTKIHIYENYILVSDDYTDLMIVLETTV